MSHLYGKEIRQLMPIVYLWAGILVFGFLGELSTNRIDEQSYADWCSEYCDPGTETVAAVITLVLILVMAYSLFPREHDDSTIDFLNSLPVTPRRIFITKLLAAWSLLCMLIIGEHAVTAALLSLNPQSISGRFYLQVDVSLLLRDALFAFVVLSYGVLLSWFRTLGLVLMSMYLLVIWWLESQIGSVGTLNLLRMMENEYHGQTLHLYWQAIATHLILSLIALLLAYRLWSRRESLASDSIKHEPGRSWPAWLAGIVAFLVLASAMMLQIGRSSGQMAIEGLQSETTEHYRFVYATAAIENASRLVVHSDADYQELASLLAAQSLPDIQVDLSSSSDHAAGLAKWKKIQMDISDFRSGISHRRVLSHETAHVFQTVESDRALSQNFNAVRFFVEGMAQYTSFIIAPDDARRRSNWQIAAMAWHRQKIRFETLIDDAAFAKKHDAELYYGIGDIWTDALVETCEIGVLGNFLRAAGREGAPVDLPGPVFWRDTMQHVGCDLEEVNSTWRTQMRELTEQLDRAHFPRFENVTVRRDQDSSRVLIRASLEPDDDSPAGNPLIPPERFSIRINSNRQFAAGVDPVFTGRLVNTEGNRNVEYSIPASFIERNQFRYQLGYMPFPDSRNYFEQWQSGSVSVN